MENHTTNKLQIQEGRAQVETKRERDVGEYNVGAAELYAEAIHVTRASSSLHRCITVCKMLSHTSLLPFNPQSLSPL